MKQSAVVEETVITGEWAFDISKISSELIPINRGDPKRIKSKVISLLKQQGNEWRIARVMSVLVPSMRAAQPELQNRSWVAYAFGF
jgi:hypothetical protein